MVSGSDEALLREAIESLADRGVLGYERIDEPEQTIYAYSHARARQHREVIENYKLALLVTLPTAVRYSHALRHLLLNGETSINPTVSK